ncbi:MAG: hypothetical protein ACTSVI_04525, partial [Promethearchaeota archaeon]
MKIKENWGLNKKSWSIFFVGGVLVGMVISAIFFVKPQIPESSPPTVIINNPVKTTYTSSTQLVNITAIDASGIDTIWYNWNGTNVTYTSPLNITFPEGMHALQAWANDTRGNVGYTFMVFTIDSTNPIVVINNPVNTTYTSSTQLV